jgi:hypothetical protein
LRNRQSRFSIAAMVRGKALVVAAAAALAVPSGAAAASPSFKLRTPSAGDMSVTHVEFSAKGSPKLALTNARKLPSEVLAVGGIKRLGGGRYFASLVLVRSNAEGERGGGATSALARIAIKRGGRFRGFGRRIVAANVVSREPKTTFCRSLPRSYSHVARKPLRGFLIAGFSARTTAKYASLAGCRTFPQREAFLQAIRGGGTGGGGTDEGGTGTGEPNCEVEDCGGDSPEGPAISGTLKGGGTVTRDASNPNLFTYSISFNEAVNGYRIEVPKTNIRCPAPSYAAWSAGECDPLGNSNTPSAANGMTLKCQSPASTYTYDFMCHGPETGTRDRESGQYQDIPGGTTITGRFTIDAGSVETVRLIGLQGSNTESQPATLAGP